MSLFVSRKATEEPLVHSLRKYVLQYIAIPNERMQTLQPRYSDFNTHRAEWLPAALLVAPAMARS